MSQNLENKEIFIQRVLGCYNPGKSIIIKQNVWVNVNFWESGFRPDENTKEKNELKRELLNLDGLYHHADSRKTVSKCPSRCTHLLSRFYHYNFKIPI